MFPASPLKYGQKIRLNFCLDFNADLQNMYWTGVWPAVGDGVDGPEKEKENKMEEKEKGVCVDNIFWIDFILVI